ncbi:MAG TPA: BTAD domain-containing putative transcriptional regulator [Pseudonocardia sp.]|nr:BTAD domain-containing putative transcriptional regulator [Pseudonocardia sp.]
MGTSVFPVLTVAVLGRVVVRRDGVPAAVPTGRTTELLIRLALEGGRPVRAQRLAEDLWPGGVRPNTLQVKVSQLRRALGGAAAVPSGPAGYALVADTVDAVDAIRLAAEGAARLADGDPEAAATACRAGLRLFDTEVLPAAGDGDWVAPHRVRLTEVRLRLTEDELAARLALGAAGELVGELEALVAEHPLREGLWALLVTALYRAARPADALAAHRRVTRMLADELGVDPGPALAALAQQVLVHDPALGGPPRGNLPAPTTPLVGRGTELAAVRAALDEHRLVTVVGPAGVGKTRLAVEAARGRQAPHGTWLVRLEGVRTADELPTALAEALPGNTGLAGLRTSDVLLVLDNCEHLVGAVGDAVTQVLDAAPGVRVLATSQRALGVGGERIFPLAPLADDDAVALFTARAHRAAGVGPDVLPLCRALDGLPLAIELAAARTRVLSVPEILRRLDDRFALLADPTARGPERRRTLAAALAWSYDLLFPDDQRGLWALAAFPAGASLAALEHVLAALDVPRAAALDVVERLVDRSLVLVDAHPTGTRYRLLDGVRAFAWERAGAVAGIAEAALVDWVTRLAATVDAGVRGPEQAALVAVTAAERATIDAALALAGPEVGADIAVGFGWAWVLLDDAGAAGRLRPFADRADARLLLSFVEAMSGDLRAARAALDGVRDGDPDRARWFGGFVLSQEGRFAEAAADLETCHTAFSARGEEWWAGGSLLLAAFARLGLGDVATAADHCAAAIRIVEPLGDAWALQHAEAALGRIAQATGRFADAARHHARAAAATERLGFPGATALHLLHLAKAQLAADDPAAAATVERAAAGAERAGDRRLLTQTRVIRAELLLADGHRDAARELLVAADRWYSEFGAGEGADLARELLQQVET